MCFFLTVPRRFLLQLFFVHLWIHIWPYFPICLVPGRGRGGRGGRGVGKALLRDFVLFSGYLHLYVWCWHSTNVNITQITRIYSNHRIYRMISDRQVCANSVDPDETSQNATSHQVLHCLPFIQRFLDITSGRKLFLFKF